MNAFFKVVKIDESLLGSHEDLVVVRNGGANTNGLALLEVHFGDWGLTRVRVPNDKKPVFSNGDNVRAVDHDKAHDAFRMTSDEFFGLWFLFVCLFFEN